MDDDDLVARVAAGDDTALRELFGRHAPWLAVRLRAVLPAADVEDVVQETFLAAWRGARGYRPQGACGGWLWGIARRQAALLLRRRSTADRIVTTWPEDLAAGRDVPDPAETAQFRADLEVGVATLGPAGSPDREVWRLMYEQDRPVAEVAELLGVPPGTVKSRAHRARRLLRAALRVAEGGTDGAPGPGPRGVRGQRRARPGRLGGHGVRGRGRRHLRLADPDDRGLRLRAGGGDGGPVGRRRGRGGGGRLADHRAVRPGGQRAVLGAGLAAITIRGARDAAGGDPAA